MKNKKFWLRKAFDPYFQQTGEDKETDTEYMTQYYPGSKTLYFSFHGASSKIDFKQALKARKEYYYGYEVHSGTLEKFKSIAVELENEYCKYYPEKIICTAMSQGAAIAQIFYIWLIRHLKYRKEEIEILLVAPYKAVYNGKHYFTSIVGTKDVVPLWSLFEKGRLKKVKVKSPYCFFQFKKNHLAYKEILRLEE